ncbi:hypothetical protein DY000_02016933 [Brassica cretica]|uniref:Uncharacterized protein n=1 Tax=Brassica cretica TaxID=69181 RepID=A0ABQ7CZ32_BRACR|nr:hypothetical protein DY000_02016933 [Brassica cretica]
MGPKPWLILPVLRAGPDRRTGIVSEVEMGYDLSVTAYGALVRHALRRYVVVAWICGYCTGSQLLVHVSSSLCLELSLELCGLLW